MTESGRGHAAQPRDALRADRLKRLEDENEQLRVSVENLREEAEALAEERASLERQLQHRTAELRRAEARLVGHEEKLQELRSRLSESSARLFDDVVSRSETAATEEELRVALEEMQVLTEELEDANAALNLANWELDQRVAARTEALAKANEALQQSEERLRLALSFASAGAWEWDTSCGKATWSKEWCALHGLDPASITPCRATWLDCIHPEDRAGVEAAFLACIGDGKHDFAAEYRLEHPQQGLRWLAGRGRLLHDEHGNPMRLTGLTFDITARKSAELAVSQHNTRLQEEVEAAVAAREAAQMQLLQTMKMEALGQLTGGVAHDFNNVLAVLTSGMSLLLRADSDEQRAHLVQSMMQAAQRGANLTQRLLSFARRQPLHPEPLDLGPWLREMHDLAAPVLRAGIQLTARMEGDVGLALVDRSELELAVLNLFVNARDAMPRGGTIMLSARKRHLEAGSDPDGLEGDFVEISLADEGQGMPPEILPRIFEPFFTTKPAGQGTGLGLPQVYGFAQQSGGTVRVVSKVGRGTTVSLFLPCVDGQGLPSSPGESALNAEPEDPSLRILLVEDDGQVAEMTTELLKGLGHAVQRASNADEALRLLEERQFSFLLTDVMLGGGPDGIELAANASRLWPDLPLLLVSGYGGMPERVAATGLPLLRKPYGPDDLRQAIRAACTRAGCALPRQAGRGDIKAQRSSL